MVYRTALITGASGGIGAALARRIARAGATVALAARRREELEELADLIRREDGDARVYTMDVGEPEAVTQIVRRIDDELGGLELVVANAGIGGGRRAAGELDWQHVAPVVQVNVMGAVATLLAALPAMLVRGRGHLVGMSSLAQYRGLPRSAAYCASKAFLSTFLESLRVDLRNSEIFVSDVRPGFVRTAMTHSSQDPTPFMIDPAEAAESIYDAIAARHSVHAFPLGSAAMVKMASLLPNTFYDLVANRVRSS